MLGLVDYAGSDNSSDEEETSVQQTETKNPIKVAVAEEDSFFDTGEGSDDGGSVLHLPEARVHSSFPGKVASEENDIEDIAKPKDWEKKLAEKARQKLEKKAAKRAEKEKRKAEKKLKKKSVNSAVLASTDSNPKAKRVKIDAFGGLCKAVAEEEDDRITQEKKQPAPAAGLSLGLFSMLPAPKSGSRPGASLGGFSSSGDSLMLPPSLRAKQSAVPTVKPRATANPVKSLVESALSSDDEDESEDFFGLTSASFLNLPSTSSGIRSSNLLDSVPIIPSNGLSETVGPSKPESVGSLSYGYEEVEEGELAAVSSTAGPSSKLKTINDQRAQEMIFKYEFAPWGADRRAVGQAEIVDVNVDSALGPNVRETLLKNITHKAIATASMPSVPKTANPKDRLAKRKHQITYLANVAVAREEALQQQWAESKNNKRMSRQKYGF